MCYAEDVWAMEAKKKGEKIGEKRGLKIGEKRGVKIGEKIGEKRGLKIGMENERHKGIAILLECCREMGIPGEKIVAQLRERYGLTKRDALKLLDDGLP